MRSSARIGTNSQASVRHRPVQTAGAPNANLKNADIGHERIPKSTSCLVPMPEALTRTNALPRRPGRFERAVPDAGLRICPNPCELLILRRARNQEPEHLIGEERIDRLVVISTLESSILA